MTSAPAGSFSSPDVDCHRDSSVVRCRDGPVAPGRGSGDGDGDGGLETEEELRTTGPDITSDSWHHSLVMHDEDTPLSAQPSPTPG